MWRLKISQEARWVVYMAISVILLIASGMLLLWSIGYMERGFIATSLLSALIGLTLFSGSLYTLRISAYVYSISRGAEGGKGEE